MDSMAGNFERDINGRTSRWFRFNVWLHRWASLIATPFFFVLCVTGTVLIFHHEIDELIGTVPSVTAAADAQLAPLAPMVQAAQALTPERSIPARFAQCHPSPRGNGLPSPHSSRSRPAAAHSDRSG